jgi:hypothetical protein
MRRYSDYHRTVVAHHGTRLSTAREIVLGNRPFIPSRNGDDWLGHGIYFWEYAPQQAFEWAKARSLKFKWDEEIAVLGSMIRLGNCFDLLDPLNVKNLSSYYQSYIDTFNQTPDVKPEVNFKANKRLNCAVFNYTHGFLETEGTSIDTYRAAFILTPDRNDRIWAGSGINNRSHIQICVRNPESILGTWIVKPEEGWGYEYDSEASDDNEYADQRVGEGN